MTPEIRSARPLDSTTCRQIGTGFRVFASLVVALGSFAFLISCDDPKVESKESRTAPAPADKTSSPFGLTSEETTACGLYGKIAGGVATDRDNGVPLSEELNEAVANFGTKSTAADEMTSLVRMIYLKPPFNKFNPEGAATGFFMDCEMRVMKNKGGAKTYTAQVDISGQLARFKTFNGRPFPALLAAYGIRIESVEVVPEKVFPTTDPAVVDDVLFTLTFATRANKSMPCRLRHWMNGEILPVIEITQRHDLFPLVNPDTADPLIYWAATGKCSGAYSF